MFSHVLYNVGSTFDTSGISKESSVQELTLTTCMENQFTCANKRCIPSSRTCDGMNDCGDYTDELSPCSGRCIF